MNDNSIAIQRFISRVARSSLQSEIRNAWRDYVKSVGMPTADDGLMQAVLDARRSGVLTYKRAVGALKVIGSIEPGWLAGDDA